MSEEQARLLLDGAAEAQAAAGTKRKVRPSDLLRCRPSSHTLTASSVPVEFQDQCQHTVVCRYMTGFQLARTDPLPSASAQ